jgi:hypothetical protein
VGRRKAAKSGVLASVAHTQSENVEKGVIDAYLALGDNGVAEPDDENTQIEDLIRKLGSEASITQHDRADRVLRVTAHSKSSLSHLLRESLSVGREPLHKIRVVLDQVKHLLMHT